MIEVSKFQNEYMKSSFLPKHETKIVRISALHRVVGRSENPGVPVVIRWA
jgi:hypothetical protein